MPNGTGLAARLQQLIDREREHSPHSVSLRRLGEDCGVSHTYMARLISGEQSNPTIEVLEAIARRFRTTVEYLYHGRRSVNVWNELMSDPRFVDLSRPGVKRGVRFAWVSRHLQLTYPGHLALADQAEEMGVSVESLEACLDGQWEPTDYQLQVLSSLSGAPVRWFQFGALAFVDLGDTEAAAAEYLEVLEMAAQHSVPPNVLAVAIRIWAEKEERRQG